MKRFIVASAIAVLGFGAIAPTASAQRQLSTPDQLSEGSSITALVQYNRDVRNKK